MAYKSKNSSGRGRSSSGRRPSGNDGEKRTWNQRTSHDDAGEETKPARVRRDEGEDRKPAFKKEGSRSAFSKERKPYSGRDEKRPYVKRSDAGDNAGGERKPYAKRGDFTDENNEVKPDTGSDEKRPFAKRENDGAHVSRERKPYAKREEFSDEKRERKPYGDREERRPYTRKSAGDDAGSERKPYVKRDDFSGEKRERKPYGRSDEKRPYAKRDGNSFARERKPYAKRDEFPREKRERPADDINGTEERSSFTREDRPERKPFERTERKPFDRKKYEGRGPYERKTGDRSFSRNKSGSRYDRTSSPRGRFSDKRPAERTESKPHNYEDSSLREEKLTRLNKYIANSGICSRREADELIKAGLISVNGEIVTEMGVKISRTDIVKYNNSAIRKERKVYVLLNKPKDYITTTDDPEERKTVMKLVENACKERIYPVGRLDRNTTGLLLITNDGELTKKLTHPANNVKKIYHVELDKNLATADLKKIAAGVELEDGMMHVDEINYDGDGKDKSQVGIAIHSGKNRVVRRIFESLGYEVKKLDRVIFAGLTKKDLPRGKWRNLSEIEVNMLKMIAGTR